VILSTQNSDEPKNEGLDENTWNNLTRLLTQIKGYERYAMEFSELSSKHNKRSIERIELLLSEANDGGTIRCSTFGCEKENIEDCYKKCHYNQEGEIINSPASKIRAAINIYAL
jgi:hypothetical protein